MKYLIRNKEGWAIGQVGEMVMKRLTREYRGEYNTIGKIPVYVFKEGCMYFGNNDISLAIFDDSYIELGGY